jgi:hypothetical protein
MTTDTTMNRYLFRLDGVFLSTVTKDFPRLRHLCTIVQAASLEEARAKLTD